MQYLKEADGDMLTTTYGQVIEGINRFYQLTKRLNSFPDKFIENASALQDLHSLATVRLALVGMLKLLASEKKHPNFVEVGLFLPLIS